MCWQLFTTGTDGGVACKQRAVKQQGGCTCIEFQTWIWDILNAIVDTGMTDFQMKSDVLASHIIFTGNTACLACMSDFLLSKCKQLAPSGGGLYKY